MNLRPIPYTVIGGYLGAGKTTLLNSLLRDSLGLRLAILVNDFGDINIDADLITSHDGETMQLASGCICCSLADGFMQALARLRDHADRIDHIIVEASGVSDPVKVGQYGAILRYELDGVIVLADAEQIRDKAANKYVGEAVIRQLRGADLLVLNKVDLVTPEELADARAWLGATAPGVRIVEATFGQVPPAVLLGELTDTRPETGPLTSDQDHHAHDHDDAGETHSDVYRTWSITNDEPIAEARLAAMLEQLPESVLRAKGFVYLADDLSRRYLVQLVGRRWSLTRQEPWGNIRPQTSLVFIGLRGEFDEARLADDLFGRRRRA
ncbi:MAG: GTP-binding protein [Chloroflexota bacterium]|jgi:G3E family GTPase